MVSVRRTNANFPGGYSLFAEQILFFQEPFLCVHRTDSGQMQIFQEHFFSYRTDINIPGALFWLPNRYRFF